MAVEGRKRTFALSGPYIPAPYTSSDSEKPNEMPRNSATSGTCTKTTGTFKFVVVFFWILNASLSGSSTKSKTLRQL